MEILLKLFFHEFQSNLFEIMLLEKILGLILTQYDK